MKNLNTDTIKTCILGHAVGDALGVPVEFQSRKQLEQTPVTDMRGFGSYSVPAGSWSDDTSMTLCALDALAEERFSWEAVMVNFGKWYYNDEFTPTGRMFDVGFTCGSAIDSFFIRHTDVCHCGRRDAQSNGNGSLMRIIPFALYGYSHPNMLRELVETGSALTHAHPRSQIACFIYACILLNLIETRSKNAVIEGIEEAKRYYGGTNDWGYYANLSAIGKRSRGSIRSGGYVVDTLEAALWCLITTDSYRDCVLKAVNLGEDTDTVAAVAGGLAGTLYGQAGIPQEWLDTLLKRDYIEHLCEKAGERWGIR